MNEQITEDDIELDTLAFNETAPEPEPELEDLPIIEFVCPECGVDISGPSQEGVNTAGERHISANHPQQPASLSREDVLKIVAELEASKSSTSKATPKSSSEASA